MALIRHIGGCACSRYQPAKQTVTTLPESALTANPAGTALFDPDQDALRTALRHDALAIEQTLDHLLPIPPTAERRLWQAMRYAVLNGGKRLRGFLVLRIAALFGADPEAALRVAAAVEMLHAYSLIHDDLPAMDDDDLRRGQPSCHRAFDEATAILAGDALQTLAFEILADPATSPDAEIRCALVLALSHAAGAAGMVGGQMADMAGQGQVLSESQVLRMQALKTGRLIQFSAEAGAILAGAPALQRRRAAAYGGELGAAFQIADDLLDTLATTAELGKSAGKDQASGKATLVALLGVAESGRRAAGLADGARRQLDQLWAADDSAATGSIVYLDLPPRAASTPDASASLALLRALATYVVSRRN